MKGKDQIKGSFRDPDGFMFAHAGKVYRHVSQAYAPDFNLLTDSGLYAELVEKKFLIPHIAHPSDFILGHEQAYRILEPEQLDFISYPYEWSFSQLKDAALLTLDVQLLAMSRGLTLKDASAYNVQFHKGKPIFIDTLSFTTLQEGQPWQAYRQFCQHFLAPLALMKHVDISLNQLMRVHLDGIPLDIAAKLLPFKTRFNMTLATNIHLHARLQSRYSAGKEQVKQRQVSKNGVLGLLQLLKNHIAGLSWNPHGTEWAAYYNDTNYSAIGLEHKTKTIRKMLEKAAPKRVLDLGANNGMFSRMAAESAELVLSCDIDPAAVEQNFRTVKSRAESTILPLLIDITNPPAASGWANAERASFLERAQVDLTMMLALIHHLCISNNLPLEEVAAMASRQSKWLIIEFVPKEDSQVARLLVNRQDIFTEYDQVHFEQAFRTYFKTIESVRVEDSQRILYLLERHEQFD